MKKDQWHTNKSKYRLYKNGKLQSYNHQNRYLAKKKIARATRRIDINEKMLHCKLSGKYEQKKKSKMLHIISKSLFFLSSAIPQKRNNNKKRRNTKLFPNLVH